MTDLMHKDRNIALSWLARTILDFDIVLQVEPFNEWDGIRWGKVRRNSISKM